MGPAPVLLLDHHEPLGLLVVVRRHDLVLERLLVHQPFLRGIQGPHRDTVHDVSESEPWLPVSSQPFFGAEVFTGLCIGVDVPTVDLIGCAESTSSVKQICFNQGARTAYLMEALLFFSCLGPLSLRLFLLGVLLLLLTLKEGAVLLRTLRLHTLS